MVPVGLDVIVGTLSGLLMPLPDHRGAWRRWLAYGLPGGLAVACTPISPFVASLLLLTAWAVAVRVWG